MRGNVRLAGEKAVVGDCLGADRHFVTLGKPLLHNTSSLPFLVVKALCLGESVVEHDFAGRGVEFAG